MKTIKRIYAILYNFLNYIGYIALIAGIGVRPIDSLLYPMDIGAMFDAGRAREIIARWDLLNEITIWFVLAGALCFVIAFSIKSELLRCQYCGENSFTQQGIRKKVVYCTKCGKQFEMK